MNKVWEVNYEQNFKKDSFIYCPKLKCHKYNFRRYKKEVIQLSKSVPDKYENVSTIRLHVCNKNLFDSRKFLTSDQWSRLQC